MDGERFVAPLMAAKALRAALRPGAPKDLPIDDEVGFLLLAEFIQMVRDFHGAYLKDA